MSLLEIVAEMSARAHLAKEKVTAAAEAHDGCVCDTDYCRAEMPPGVVVYRGGHQHVAMTLSDGTLWYPLTIAARMFAADAVAVVMDGRDKRTDRPIIAVAAVNRAGDELWRVEPYSIAPDGRSVIWWPAEVPDEHPILEDCAADRFVNIMNRSVMPWPPHYDSMNLSFEARQVCTDIGITKQIAKRADRPYANIVCVSLAAEPGTERERILSMAGEPEIWVL